MSQINVINMTSICINTKQDYLLMMKNYRDDKGFPINRLILNCDISIPIIPKTVKHLTIGTVFNKPILVPKSITHLTIQEVSLFNYPLLLQNKMKNLKMNQNYKKKFRLPCDNMNITLYSDIRPQYIRKIDTIIISHDYSHTKNLYKCKNIVVYRHYYYYKAYFNRSTNKLIINSKYYSFN